MSFQRVEVQLSIIKSPLQPTARLSKAAIKAGFASLPWELSFYIFQMIADAGSLNACSLVSKELFCSVVHFKASVLKLYWGIDVDVSSSIASTVKSVITKTIRAVGEADNPCEFKNIEGQLIMWQNYLAHDGWNQMFSKRSTVFSVFFHKLVGLAQKEQFHEQYLKILKVVCRSNIDYNIGGIAAPPLLAVAATYSLSPGEALYYKALFSLLIAQGADPFKIYKDTTLSTTKTCVICRLQRDGKQVLLSMVNKKFSRQNLLSVCAHSCNRCLTSDISQFTRLFFLFVKLVNKQGAEQREQQREKHDDHKN